MKTLFIGGITLYPSIDPVDLLEKQLQSSYNSWLGFDDNGEPKLKVKITQLEKNKRYRFDFTRHYGDFYQFRQSSDQNTSIFAWDEQLILGEDREEGTMADFDVHHSRYIIYHEVEYVRDRLKAIGKQYKSSRIKAFDYEQIDRDNFSITITL